MFDNCRGCYGIRNISGRSSLIVTSSTVTDGPCRTIGFGDHNSMFAMSQVRFLTNKGILISKCCAAACGRSRDVLCFRIKSNGNKALRGFCLGPGRNSLFF